MPRSKRHSPLRDVPDSDRAYLLPGTSAWPSRSAAFIPACRLAPRRRFSAAHMVAQAAERCRTRCPRLLPAKRLACTRHLRPLSAVRTERNDRSAERPTLPVTHTAGEFTAISEARLNWPGVPSATAPAMAFCRCVLSALRSVLVSEHPGYFLGAVFRADGDASPYRVPRRLVDLRRRQHLGMPHVGGQAAPVPDRYGTLPIALVQEEPGPARPDRFAPDCTVDGIVKRFPDPVSHALIAPGGIEPPRNHVPVHGALDLHDVLDETHQAIQAGFRNRDFPAVADPERRLLVKGAVRNCRLAHTMPAPPQPSAKRAS